MELPSYRLPSFKTVCQLLWDKTKDFIQRAFGIIFIATIVIWFLQNFSFNLSMVDDTSKSMLSIIASSIAPIFSPCGYGDWRIVVSLISGLLAKETIVSTLSILTSSSLTTILSSASAISLLVFCLLYSPCVATIAAIKQETDNRHALFVVIFQCLIAWILSFITFNIAILLI